MANETNTGWVRLYRSTLGWEWFNDPLTLQLWIVCLLKANHAPSRWQGVDIERGSFVSSVEKLCAATGQTARQIRTRLSNLQTSRELSIKATNRYSIITICNYDIYQPIDIEDDKPTDKRPTNGFEGIPELSAQRGSKTDERNDKQKHAINDNPASDYNDSHPSGDEPIDMQSTSNRQANDKRPTTNNNNKESKNKNKSLSSRARAREAERETFFEIFFFRNFQKPEYEVERFCANYEASGWIRKNGRPVFDRPALARTWTQEDPKATSRFPDEFLKKWRILYNDAKDKDPASAWLLIHGLRGVTIQPGTLTLICSSELGGLIEKFWQAYFVRFFSKFFNGLAINKRII